MAEAPAHLLLVDDDHGNRVTLAALLEEEGFAVDTADSIEAALKLLQTNTYRAVLLDLHLGEHSGVELIPTVRARSPRTRVIIVTASSADERPLVAEADAVVLKGELEALLTALERV